MESTDAAFNAGLTRWVLEFKYDYMGRRVQKRSNNVTADTDVYTRYIYDGWNVVAEFSATATSIGTMLRSFTWGLDVAGSFNATGGVGALVQIADHQNGKTYFPTYDGSGNVSSLVDSADGSLAAIYEYSPFGELLRSEGAYAAANPFCFSTKWTDAESGLSYYGYRYYSPALGRFINRDPIEEQGGLNLYGFVGNNPTSRWDVLGLELWCHPAAYECDCEMRDGVYHCRGSLRPVGWVCEEVPFPAPTNSSGSSHPPSSNTVGDGTASDSPASEQVANPAPKKTEEKMPCSELRKQMLKEVLPSSSGAKAALAGSGSYFRGNWRALNESLDWAFGSAEESAASWQASGQLAFFVDMYRQSGDFRSAVNDIAITYVSQNWEKTAGRVGTGVGVSLGLNKGLGWGKGGSVLGTMMSVNATLGDMRYMIRQGVHPALAMAASMVDGQLNPEMLGDAVEAVFNDNEKLMQFTGIDCDPTK